MTMNRNRSADRKAFEALTDMPKLVRGGRVQAHWLPDGRFWFVEGAPENTVIRVFDPGTKAVSDLFDTHVLRSALRDVVGREPPYQGVPFEQFGFEADSVIRFTFEGSDYRFDSAAGVVTPVRAPSFNELHLGTDPASRARPNTMMRPSVFPDPQPVPEPLSPDGRRFASLQNGDIYIRSVSDGRYDRLTSDAEPRNGWDIESTRLGISSSGSIMYLTVSPWSPDGTRLYATRFDERLTRPHSRIRYLRHFDEVEEQTIARAGDALPQVQPFVFDIFGGRRVALDIDGDDCFILMLGWAPSGDALYLTRFSRDMSRAEVIAADPVTGAARTLFAERSETFLRIQHEVIGGRSGCTVLPNGLGFLWQSERDGWKHLYHYSLEGELVRQLTEGQWPMAEVLGIDPEAEYVYFNAALDQQRPYDLHIARVRLAGGEIEQLTREPGLHEAQLAPDFACFVDTVQRPDLPPRSRVVAADGDVLHEFPPADVSSLEAAGWTPPEEFSVKAADGETDLHGLLLKPRDFNPAQRYPVIEYLYAGPQITAVNRNFTPTMASRMYAPQALAQLGYIVIVLDARGTPRRSKAFQDEVYRNWRRSVTADHAAALRDLGSTRPWMRMDRVGIWGHSWGGYFTIANMLDNPDLYRAGVASAPGCDPYAAFIYEPYLGGVPSAATKAAYDGAVLYNDAGKLDGALMIAAGTNDVGVWHSAINMAHALIEAGKAHDFVVLPDQHHGYGRMAEDHFVKKMLAHFERYLQRDEEIAL